MSTPEFELIVGEANGEIHNADIPVRWCVTPTLVKQMEDAGIVDPHVLILTATKSGQEIQRQVVPITELMTYARFTKAGDMRIYGWIVNGEMGRKKLHKNLTRKVNGWYETELIDEWDGVVYEKIGKLSYAHVGMNVEIPTGVFGKEPSPWVKWFSNLWHESRTADQCNFRRRMFLAFTLKWIPVLIFTLASVFARSATALLFYSIGYRQWVSNPKYLLKPFDTDFDDSFDVTKFGVQEFLFRRKTKYLDNYYHGQVPIEQTHVLLTPFTPIIPLLVFFVSWLAIGSWGASAIFTLKLLAFLLTITAVIDIANAFIIYAQNTSVISKSIDFVISKTYDNWHRFDTYMVNTKKWPATITITVSIITILLVMLLAPYWKFGLMIVATLVVMTLVGAAALWLFDRFTIGDTTAADYTEIRELLCPKDEENKIAEYKAIPKEQRSLRLWYLDVKNKVCKPMQL